MNSLKIRRIQAALAAINAHTAAKGNAEELAVSEDRSHVDDLLADLMHYCAQSEIDFDFHLSVARGHFKAEKEVSVRPRKCVNVLSIRTVRQNPSL